MKLYVSALVDIIKVTLQSARCNNEESFKYYSTITSGSFRKRLSFRFLYQRLYACLLFSVLVFPRNINCVSFNPHPDVT